MEDFVAIETPVNEAPVAYQYVWITDKARCGLLNN